MNNQTLRAISSKAERPLLRRQKSNPSLTIMVVEDSEDIRSMMRILLEMEGFSVVEAADGLRAVELAINERPALIMMDLTLPLLDGLSATARIREQLRDVPIVAVSGHESPDYRMAAINAGCTDYLLKPLDFKRLNEILNRLSC
jgi:two-component system, cell cycle response regulator DivK